MTKIILITMVVIAPICNCFSQMSLDYAFDKSVNEAILTFLDQETSKQPGADFYIILSAKTDRSDGSVYKLLICPSLSDSVDFVQEICKKSTRRFNYRGKSIPICFDYDFRFLSYGVNNKGHIRRHPLGNGYVIEFTKSGKVIKRSR